MKTYHVGVRLENGKLGSFKVDALSYLDAWNMVKGESDVKVALVVIK